MQTQMRNRITTQKENMILFYYYAKVTNNNTKHEIVKEAFK